MPADDTGEIRYLRMSPQFAALRLAVKQSCEAGTVRPASNPRISGREEVGAMGWSQVHRDASLPQGRDGLFSRPLHSSVSYPPARRETPAAPLHPAQERLNAWEK